MKRYSRTRVSYIKRCFCSPKRPYWLWDPPNRLSNEYFAAIFTGHEVEHHFHPVTRLRMNGSVPTLPIYLHGEHRDTFAFTFNCELRRPSILNSNIPQQIILKNDILPSFKGIMWMKTLSDKTTNYLRNNGLFIYNMLHVSAQEVHFQAVYKYNKTFNVRIT